MAISRLTDNSLQFSSGKSTSIPVVPPFFLPYTTIFSTLTGWSMELPSGAPSDLGLSSIFRSASNSMSVFVGSASSSRTVVARFLAMPGRTYSVSFWARQSQLSGTGNRVSFSIASGGSGSAQSINLQDTFVQTTGTFTATAPIILFRFTCITGTMGSRTFYIDDLAIERF